MRLFTRLLGVLLALIGLVPLAVGGWFATQLGSEGTATFVIDADGTQPVLITPEVLNRTDLPVTVTVTGGAEDGYLAVGTPSDTSAVLESAARTEVLTVTLPDWVATTSQSGTGDPGELRELDVWRDVASLEERTTLTVTQENAPESVLIVPGAGGFGEATLSWTYGTWFWQAVVLAAAGAVLVVVGLLVALPRRRAARKETT